MRTTTSSHVTDHLSWLWLLLGAALLPFTQFQTVLPLAAWLAPVFLLRFTRTQRAWVALPVVGLVQYAAAAIALRGYFPAPDVFLFGLIGVMGVFTYAADKALAGRLNGLPRTFVFPAVTVIADWLFGLSPLGTFMSSVYSQFGNLPLTQLVSLTGIWGLGFLIAWLAPVVNEVWERGLNRDTIRRSLAPFVVVLSCVLIYGSLRVAFFEPNVRGAAPTVRVAALAADRARWHGLRIPPLSELASADDSVRADARAQFAPIADELFTRTEVQARAGAKIVVWSEAAAFALEEDEPELIARAQALARQEGIYLQMGLLVVLRTDKFPFAGNRAVMIDPSGQVVWDYIKSVPALGEAQVMAAGPGIVPVVDTPYGRLAAVICFDADFPALIRQAGQARADILLVPANDWEPEDVMHARAATFRAIENGVALVRATGNGISIAVDDMGQELATADYFATDKLTMAAEVPTRGLGALYPRIGDSVAYLCIAGLVLLAGLGIARRAFKLIEGNAKMKRFQRMLISLVATLLLLSAVLYAFAPHTPATPKQVANMAELETYLNQLVASGNPPGMSVVVVKEGAIVYNNAFGYADGPRGISATPDTVYHWWSMTKIPTAIAVVQLQEQGKLNLDDEVTEYLPWFEVDYPSSASPAVTIRNLLQHTSGLPNTIPAMVGWVHYDDSTRNQTDVAKNHLPEFNTLKFEPGAKAMYSNLNYMVLGAIIETVSGQTYESYITENILQPLGMSHTGFVYTPAMAEHEAAGTLPLVHFYTPLLPTLLDPNALIRERQGKLLWLNRVYIDATPSTGLIGSAPDVARFLLAYLNHFEINGGHVLRPESASTLTDTAPIDGHGLGWFIGESNHARYLEHAGGGPGFATIMRVYPDEGLGIAILANGTDLDRSGLTDLLAGMDW